VTVVKRIDDNTSGLLQGSASCAGDLLHQVISGSRLGPLTQSSQGSSSDLTLSFSRGESVVAPQTHFCWILPLLGVCYDLIPLRR
jgi:hypothetical protein